MVTAANLKVEICVIGFARTLDWHGYKNLLLNLSIAQVKMLEHRIGYINLFDDVMVLSTIVFCLIIAVCKWMSLSDTTVSSWPQWICILCRLSSCSHIHVAIFGIVPCTIRLDYA